MLFRTLCLALAPVCAQAAPDSLWHYDGDSFAVSFRMTIDGTLSFDAPETSVRYGAECPEEIVLGKAAKKRAEEIRKAAETIRVVPLLRDDGSIQTTDERRPRFLAQEIIDGAHMGDLLAAEGLSMRYFWQTQKVDWCASPAVVRER